MVKSNYKLLLIDDDPLFLSLLSQVLTPQGYQVITAKSYEEGKSRFEEERFALVLVDFQFTGTSKTGLDLARDFRKAKHKPEIIVVTGHPSLDLAMDAMQEEVYDFITKPASVLQVKQTIDRALQKFDSASKQKKLNQQLIVKNKELEKTNEQLLKALEDARNYQHQLAASKKLAGIGEMTASVAHECNNILGAIRGYSQLALRKPDKQEFLYDLHGKIKDAVDRAIDVVQNLLQVSRRIKPKKEASNINDAISETLKLAEHHLKLKHIKLMTSYSTIPDFLFDVGQLQQVFLNLVTNATHALEEGGDLIIRTAFESELVTVEFRDTGAGIPTQLMDKIFLPFFTTKTGQAGEESEELGSGLGLFVSRQILEAHDGALEVSSKLGVGTCFKITLPFRTNEKEEDDSLEVNEVEETNEFEEETSASDPLSGMDDLRALIVDDEPDIRLVLRRFLEEKGFEVEEAKDGVECLEQLEKDSNFHLIFLDLMMPRMTGEEVLHEIKDLYDKPSVIMMSGYGKGSTTTNMLALGADKYIAKPFDLDELEADIDDEIARKAEL